MGARLFDAVEVREHGHRLRAAHRRLGRRVHELALVDARALAHRRVPAPRGRAASQQQAAARAVGLATAALCAGVGAGCGCNTHPLASFIILTGRKRKHGPLSRIMPLAMLYAASGEAAVPILRPGIPIT